MHAYHTSRASTTPIRYCTAVPAIPRPLLSHGSVAGLDMKRTRKDQRITQLSLVDGSDLEQETRNFEVGVVARLR